MCGIVGVVGNTNATDILIQGLEKLEYRGMIQLVSLQLGMHLVNWLRLLAVLRNLLLKLKE